MDTNSAVATDRRAGQVTAMLDQLGGAQSELGELLSMLRDRLGRVLVPMPQPSAPDNNAMAVPSRSNIADQLDDRNRVCADHIRMVKTLLDELDL